MNTWDSTAITLKIVGTPLTDADEGRFAQTKDPFDIPSLQSDQLYVTSRLPHHISMMRQQKAKRCCRCNVEIPK